MARLEYMRDLRKAQGLKMKDLADRIGCSEAAISKYENGTRDCDFETLLKIAEELDTTIDYLFFGPRRITECTAEERMFLDVYEKASPDDKQVIKLILKKYEEQP